MDRFKIELSPAASRDLDDLEIEVVAKVLSDLKIIEENPFPRGKLIKKIKGKKSAFYRLRIDKFRVFFEIQHMKIVILRILSKKEVDRFIKKL
ncbi:MAG TPA: type II toxin-antitoxin system RelE/ParE family toxin [Thermodesulfobacteriota bacterium]|nr:type II toxin-antitoxin system RelE/ParE family toxin [Thermodesulfobacteriota bacterium]